MPATPCYRVTYDGYEKMVGTHDECFTYILRHQGQSVMYATTYGGWAIEPVARLPERSAGATDHA